LARTRVWHRLRNHYFSLYFPEIEHFIRSDHSDWLIQLLLGFPTSSGGGIDILVSNAGYSQPCSFEELTEEMWARK
jgi:NAD(P)-dependent dehydrogenase (short-subunit alcohol dehydrogenase family)